MRVFELSKQWPVEERYALTDQARRSSRSICSNLAEAWHKRRYPDHFLSNLTDASAEAGETRVWLEFAFQCGYLHADNHATLMRDYAKIGGMLNKMMVEPTRWTPVVHPP
jgi:four helix bundle protein